MLGMDAARQGYYRSYGGSPGPGATCSASSATCSRRAGIDAAIRHRLFVANPARAFAFAEVGSMSHEPLLTSVVGSHARPGWFVAGIAAAERGEFGPADLEEMLDDAVDLALRDQEEAGHRRRQRRRDATGRLLHRRVLRAPDRRPGRSRRIGGWAPAGTTSSIDSRSSSRSPPRTAWASSRSTPTRSNPHDASAQGHAPRAVHAVRPADLRARAQVYTERNAAAEAFVPILRAELEGLADAGATIIQIDEPSPAIHPDAPADFAALFNAAVEPVVGKARLGAHLCFGNYLGRPLARRTYRPVLRCDARLPCRRARPRVRQPRDGRGRRSSREIAAAGRDVAAGVIDVKNSYIETADDVAERIDAVLAPASRPSGSRSSPTAASARPHAG